MPVHGQLADETNLTLFNTTSDQSTAYPLFLSSALIPRGTRRKPGNLVHLALLPKYLKRLHRLTSSARHAHNKRVLTWSSLQVVLQDLFEESLDGGPIPGYWYVSFVLSMLPAFLRATR